MPRKKPKYLPSTWYDAAKPDGTHIITFGTNLGKQEGVSDVKPVPLFQRKQIPEGLVCKACGKDALYRYGTYNDVQRWQCITCGATFMQNDALPHGRVSADLIAEAVSSFYEGLSLNAIRRQLKNSHGIFPSDSTIYDWVVKFTKIAVKAADSVIAHVGDEWTADESVLKIGGANTWFFDCIDNKTRFLLASHITPSRFTKDAQILVERASKRAGGKFPKIIYTDKLRAYLQAIESAFGGDTKHKQGGPFSLDKNTNAIERFHSTLKARTTIMRGLHHHESAKLITDGWLVHYNYFRPHQGLNDKTPAEIARAKLPFGNWQEVVRKST